MPARRVLVAVAFAFPLALPAQNLLVNPDFERGVVGWAADVPDGFTLTVTPCDVAPGGVSQCGTLTFGGGGGQAAIAQRVATVPGTAYTFSGWYRFELPSLAGNLQVIVGGPGGSATLGGCAPGASCAFTQTFVAAASAEDFSFRVRRDAPPAGTSFPSGSVVFDQLRVSPAATTVPEPATWALLGTGLLAVGGVARRRADRGRQSRR